MTLRTICRAAGFVLSALMLSAACGKVADDASRGQDQLIACSSDDDCATGSKCLCGVCTHECKSNDTCHGLANGRCAQVGSQAFDAGCGSTSLSGICLSTCEASCPAGTRCVDDLCAAIPAVDSGQGGAENTPDAGTAGLPPDAGSLIGMAGAAGSPSDAGSLIGMAGAAGAAGAAGLPMSYGQQRVLGDGTAYGGFGQSVGLSGDALVVAEVTGANNQGLAHVYRNLANVWTYEDALTYAASFSSVAISGDTVVVGADNVNSVGACYVYQRISGQWLFQGPPLAPNDLPNGASFGADTALDGDSFVVGAPLGGADTDTSVGRAYVFAKSGSTWLQQAELAPKEAIPMDRPGAAVAISGDTIVIGAPTNPTFSVPAPGKAYVFTRAGSTWIEQAVLSATDGTARDGFGYDVAVKGDTLVVGATCPCAVGGEAGAAYVFTRSGSTWTQQAKLVQADGMAGIAFGYQVAIDTGRIVVGAYLADNAQGAAYEFVGAGATWIENRKLVANDGATNDNLGFSLALDGSNVAAGAGGVRIAGETVGAAYVFDLNGSP